MVLTILTLKVTTVKKNCNKVLWKENKISTIDFHEKKYKHDKTQIKTPLFCGIECRLK